MTVFQVLGVGFTGLTVAFVVAGALQRRLAPLPAVFWAMVFSAAAITIAAPGITVMIADALGIQRGADLVFYCAILAMLVGFMRVQTRLRQLDDSITVLTRELAIRGASEQESHAAALAEK